MLAKRRVPIHEGRVTRCVYIIDLGFKVSLVMVDARSSVSWIVELLHDERVEYKSWRRGG